MNRRSAREIAFCLIFDFGFHMQENPLEIFELYLAHSLVHEDNTSLSENIRKNKYIKEVVFGTIEKVAELDDIIKFHSSNWKIERVSRVSHAILRLSLYEIQYMKDIPIEVSINEAVELAKKFDHDDGYIYVNGVLGAAEKQIGNK